MKAFPASSPSLLPTSLSPVLDMALYLSLVYSVSRAWWLSGKESACQCRRPGFSPWSRKIPHAAEQLLSLCSSSQDSQLLKPLHPWALAPQQEKPLEWEAHAPQLVKSPPSNKDPMQPKINKQKEYSISSSLTILGITGYTHLDFSQA